MSHDFLQPEPNDELSRLLTRALETPRRFTISEGFAARTAAAAARLPVATAVSNPTRFGVLAIKVAIAALVLTLLVIAPHVHPKTLLPLLVELLFALELVVLVTWFTLGSQVSS
jgi:hypothetical protein